MGVAFREYAGPVFMDLIKELKVLGECQCALRVTQSDR